MARAISGLLVRRDREAYIDGTGESQELDFDIPRGLAIAIFGIEGEVIIGDIDGAAISMEQFVDLDGPALAGDALNTQALFEAREILDSVIFAQHAKHDALTSGASLMHAERTLWLPEPILTARNPGVAGLALGASGEAFTGIWYKWVEISNEEFIRLVVDLRT